MPSSSLTLARQGAPAAAPASPSADRQPAPAHRAAADGQHPLGHTPWGLVCLLGALTAFGAMATDLYLPSLPQLAQSLRATPGQAQGTVGAFFAGLAVGQLVYGPLSDRIGRRAPVLIGCALYTVASVACALAPSIELLLVARFVEALGAAAGAVVARAAVRDQFDARDTARILSLLVLVLGVAPILAPSAGGVLLQVTGWRGVFWVLTGVGAAVGLWSFVKLRETRSEATAAQARSENPLRAYLALGARPRLVGYLLAGALNSACLFVYVTASPDLLIGTYGFTPAQFALMFSLNGVGLIGSSQLNRWALRHLTPDQTAARAMVAALAAAVLLVLGAVTGVGGPWGVLAPLFLVLCSFGFLGANTMAGALSEDPNRAGSISALSGAGAFGLGALAGAGVSLLHDGTARPMALAMLALLIAGAAALYGLALKRYR